MTIKKKNFNEARIKARPEWQSQLIYLLFFAEKGDKKGRRGETHISSFHIKQRTKTKFIAISGSFIAQTKRGSTTEKQTPCLSVIFQRGAWRRIIATNTAALLRFDKLLIMNFPELSSKPNLWFSSKIKRKGYHYVYRLPLQRGVREKERRGSRNF